MDELTQRNVVSRFFRRGPRFLYLMWHQNIAGFSAKFPTGKIYSTANCTRSYLVFDKAVLRFVFSITPVVEP